MGYAAKLGGSSNGAKWRIDSTSVSIRAYQTVPFDFTSIVTANRLIPIGFTTFPINTVSIIGGSFLWLDQNSSTWHLDYNNRNIISINNYSRASEGYITIYMNSGNQNTFSNYGGLISLY